MLRFPAALRLDSILFSFALIAACSSVVDVNEDSQPSGTTSGEAPQTATSPTSEGATSDDQPSTTAPKDTTDVDPDETSGDSSSTSNTDTSLFLIDPDGGSSAFECSIWAENCPSGEKCMPWANDGGNSWNAWRCFAIDPDPDEVGEPCTVDGSGVSGVDSCEVHTMCWDVDHDTDMGTCLPMCIGSELEPLCADPNRSCDINGDGVLALCFPLCDPIIQDCPDGEACYVFDDRTGCAPDASGDKAGAYGDTCGFVNGCDPGLACTHPEATPGCMGTDCCTPYCDTSAPNTCPGKGQECVPVLEPIDAPPILENVGVCAVP